ncbi:MAG TPA: sigma-54 dependent transcriptional regulator [Candidatus Eisenbacteria bacterium]|jgi:DNA-binding NtrC family response regulator
MTVETRPASPKPGPNRPAGSDPFLQNIVGASPKMQRIFRLVSKVAPTDSTILLLGESGTGKELVARLIHVQSKRGQGPFVPVHMGAIPETLIESELFGHARGAFTGATAERAGLVEQADGGTLFLDEVGDMPAMAQVKLLRTLERNEVRRVGENHERVVNVRVVAATHRDLLAEIAAGRFREDLYHRLNVVQIELPALRERREDIGLLASYFLERLARRAGRPGLAFAPEAQALLERYDYPGNVRELENAIEHSVAVSEGRRIRAADLPAAIRVPRLLAGASARAGGSAGVAGAAGVGGAAGGASGAKPAGGNPSGGTPAPGPADAEAARDGWSLAQVEKEHIQRVLARHRGNATSAAKQLGISRTTLWRKLREYGLTRKGA